MTRPRGHVVFDRVSFAYGPGANATVLSNVSIQANPGSILGIVGPPGSGKTTLLNLIPRLYDVSEGAVRIDGIDLRSIVLAHLRHSIAYVPQEPFMFAGTIRDNLLFGLGSRADAVSAAFIDRIIDDVRLTETLAHMPDGLDTVVGEKGVMLSGGQKQRVALARGLLTDAPILLLDDPISQVDTETGSHIVDTIARLAGHKTVIVVSHRLAAVRNANEIISLEQGRVVETGRHADLLAAGGYYAGVHRLQELENGH